MNFNSPLSLKEKLVRMMLECYECELIADGLFAKLVALKEKPRSLYGIQAKNALKWETTEVFNMFKIKG